MISNAFYAIVPETYIEQRQANDDADDVELFDIESVFTLPLAFDHRKIISDALHFIKRDMIQTTVAKTFTTRVYIVRVATSTSNSWRRSTNL